jgi:hypothetical protein
VGAIGPSLFSVEDILSAIDQVNFNKAMGPNEFNGQLLKQSQQVRAKYDNSVLAALYQNRIPASLSKTRLIPHTKNRGLYQGSFDEIRPILVRSHLSKIMKKAILSSLMKEENKRILSTHNYKSGFKKHQSKAQNISFAMQCLNGKQRDEHKYILMVDIRKAFDSVCRHLLFDII